MKSGKEKRGARGWCPHCGALAHAARKTNPPTCCGCGSLLKTQSEATAGEKAMMALQAWFAEISRKGMDGPSPIGAAEQLGCSRSMIDRLVERDVLERNEFIFKDRHIAIISQRSLERAKENRERTGNWTGHPVRRGR
jgi:hypothetical protein